MEPTIEELNNENSVYWCDRALFSVNALKLILKENNIDEPELNFWNSYNSWKTICLKTQDYMRQIENKVQEQKAQNLKRRIEKMNDE